MTRQNSALHIVPSFYWPGGILDIPHFVFAQSELFQPSWYMHFQMTPISRRWILRFITSSLWIYLLPLVILRAVWPRFSQMFTQVHLSAMVVFFTRNSSMYVLSHFCECLACIFFTIPSRRKPSFEEETLPSCFVSRTQKMSCAIQPSSFVFL